MGVKFVLYGLASTALAISTLTYALQTREQFYPIVVFLVTSKFSILVLANFAIFCTVMAGFLTKTVFLGRLRVQEREIMFDRARYTIFDTCLTLTIFHEEITMRVFVLFITLLFSKVFHWLSECRVEHVEQADGVTRWQHVRLVSLMLSLLGSDVLLMGGCAWLAAQSMPSVLILFGFEYANLAVTVLTTLGKYVLHIIDMRVEGSWQAKWSYVKLLEIISEAIRFSLLLCFFAVLFMYYGLPLHVLRELGMSFMNLHKFVKQYKKHRKLMVGLNDRFLDATPQEIQNENGERNECIICRDPLTPGAKKLPCNHVFHLDCLRLWLHEKSGCPTCRAVIPLDGPRRPPRRLPQPPLAPVAAPGPERAPNNDPVAARNDQAPLTPEPPVEIPISEVPPSAPTTTPTATETEGGASAVRLTQGLSGVNIFAIPRSQSAPSAQPPPPALGVMTSPPPPLVLRLLVDHQCTLAPLTSAPTTRTIPAGAFVLVGGAFPQTERPEYWMTVDGDWVVASAAAVVPPPRPTTLVANTSQPFYSFNQQKLPNPFSSTAPTYHQTPSWTTQQTFDSDLSRSEVTKLDLEVKKLRSDMKDLQQQLRGKEQVEAQVDSWAESPFSSPSLLAQRSPTSGDNFHPQQLSSTLDDDDTGLRRRSKTNENPEAASH